MPGPDYSWYQLHRARAARPGVCFLCGWQPTVPGWVEETGARLCTRHNEVEMRRALAALAAADREKENVHA